MIKYQRLLNEKKNKDGDQKPFSKDNFIFVELLKIDFLITSVFKITHLSKP